MSTQVLPIACGINRAYALPLAVMLESLKQHLRPGVRPVLHLIHAGLPDCVLSAIGSIVETHSIVPSAAQLAGAPRDAHFPVEASFPLLMPELLPASLERVLFLDADMLVLGDLMHVWETPLNGHVLAAAADGAVPRCSAPRGVKGWRALHIPAEAPYFNTTSNFQRLRLPPEITAMAFTVLHIALAVTFGYNLPRFPPQLILPS
jgi:lipopolysaccharide biosynthesis glycosyltransferase